MSFHRKSQPMVEGNPYQSDEIDALVRWILRDSVAGEEPPPEVWHRIRARLGQQETQSYPRGKRLLSSAQLSWLAQLVVLGLLILMAFGLSLGQGFDFSLGHEYVVNDELTPQPGSEEAAPLFCTGDDVLSGYYFFRSARELTVFDHRLAP